MKKGLRAPDFGLRALRTSGLEAAGVRVGRRPRAGPWPGSAALYWNFVGRPLPRPPFPSLFSGSTPTLPNVRYRNLSSGVLMVKTYPRGEPLRASARLAV